jgi:hypothetical protein
LSFTPAKVGNPFVVAQKKVGGFLFLGIWGWVDLGICWASAWYSNLLGRRTVSQALA